MYGAFDEDDVTADYIQLLRRGSVVRRLALEQHSAWCQAIWLRAEADELRIRTWSRNEQPATVWAVLPDWSLTKEELESHQRRREWRQEE